MNTKLFRTALVKTIPVMTGYLALGLGYGILSQKAGYGFGWVLAMSLFIYGGSMQFLMVGLLTGGTSLLSTALTTLVVQARHLFYGISMVDRYKDAGAKKPYVIFALTDETYSLVCTDALPDGVEEHQRQQYYFLVSLLDQLYWVTGSVIGTMVGAAITFNTAGIDFSMTALFVTVFVEQWLSTKQHLPALAGLAASIACRLVFGSGSFLIPSMLAILLMLTLARPKLDVPQAAEQEVSE